MAQPTPVKHSEFLIYAGDGADPENYTKLPMAMVSRGFNTTISTTSIIVPDQDNEDEMVDEQAVPSTRKRTMSGKGTIGKDDFADWEGFQGVIKNYKISLAGIGHWIGPGILTASNISSDRTNVVQGDFTIDQAGQLVFTAGVSAKRGDEKKINADRTAANIVVPPKSGDKAAVTA